MSKTHSQPLNKETVSAIGLAVGLVLLSGLVFSMIFPGAIELLRPSKTQTGTDPIDRATVNQAIQLIGE
jgi:hypothetical protein